MSLELLHHGRLTVPDAVELIGTGALRVLHWMANRSGGALIWEHDAFVLVKRP